MKQFGCSEIDLPGCHRTHRLTLAVSPRGAHDRRMLVLGLEDPTPSSPARAHMGSRTISSSLSLPYASGNGASSCSIASPPRGAELFAGRSTFTQCRPPTLRLSAPYSIADPIRPRPDRRLIRLFCGLAVPSHRECRMIFPPQQLPDRLHPRFVGASSSARVIVSAGPRNLVPPARRCHERLLECSQEVARSDSAHEYPPGQRNVLIAWCHGCDLASSRWPRRPVDASALEQRGYRQRKRIGLDRAVDRTSFMRAARIADLIGDRDWREASLHLVDAHMPGNHDVAEPPVVRQRKRRIAARRWARETHTRHWRGSRRGPLRGLGPRLVVAAA